MVRVTITIDAESTPTGSIPTKSKTILEVTRDTEDEAAIAALALLIALYGKNLKLAAERYSDIVKSLNARLKEEPSVVSR